MIAAALIEWRDLANVVLVGVLGGVGLVATWGLLLRAWSACRRSGRASAPAGRVVGYGAMALLGGLCTLSLLLPGWGDHEEMTLTGDQTKVLRYLKEAHERERAGGPELQAQINAAPPGQLLGELERESAEAPHRIAGRASDRARSDATAASAASCL